MKVPSGSVRPGQVLYCAASKLQLRNVLLASRTKAMNDPCESVEYDALCRQAWGHDKRRSGGDTVGVGELGVGEFDALAHHPAGFSFLC